MVNLICALLSGLLGGIIVLCIPQNKQGLRNIFVFSSSLLGAFFSWRLAFLVFSGANIIIKGQLVGLPFSFQPDPLGALFGLIVSSLWLFATTYSFGYMKKKHNQKTYYTFFLMALSITLGIAFSGNLLALYLFYELLTFATYPLVVHERSPEAIKAGAKYIIYSLSGAGALLVAIILTYARTGNLSFIGSPIFANFTDPSLNWILLLFICGFGVKAAIMPLHRWLPAAMVAPTPVSALLHAVAVVYSGVFGILRVVYSVFGPAIMQGLTVTNWLPWLATITILIGVSMATQQDVLKRRLAYNTIGELSYILLGAFVLQNWGLTGALIHMVGYSTLKITLFFCAGIISEQTGEVRISKMRGIGWALPKTMTIFALASLGMVGMLPLSTFWSKFYLMKGSLDSGQWIFALVLLISGIINAICYIPIVINAFKREKSYGNSKGEKQISAMLLPSILLTVIAILLGLWPGLIWPGLEAVIDWFF